MKNFIFLHSGEEVFQYTEKLWQSDIFKKSMQEPDGYIRKLTTEFSKKPRLFFDMHKERLEMVHFSSWFHAIQHRYHYTDPVIHDLYYHHELMHLTTASYPGYTENEWDSWFEKMKENEFWCSLESECLIYFYLPELREKSFTFELWVDKFLYNPDCQVFFGQHAPYENSQGKRVLDNIVQARLDCEIAPVTALDKMIADYTVSSRKWAEIWQENQVWLTVENHMKTYLTMLEDNEYSAMQFHLNWIYELQNKNSDNIAFVEQAAAYSEVHQSLFQSAYEPVN